MSIESWSECDYQDDAQKQYIDLVASLVGAEEATAAATSSGEAGKYETLLVNNTNGVYSITLNRPSKKNAINIQVSSRFFCSLSDWAKQN